MIIVLWDFKWFINNWRFILFTNRYLYHFN